MKRFLLLLSLLFIGVAMADNTPTSVGYVDAKLDALQATIPAAGATGVGMGTSVITYTATSGEIGERELFTGGKYTASTDADKLITAAALNTAFTTLPETDTTTLKCANPGTCTLWTIVDQMAYGVSNGGSSVAPATIAMLNTLIDTVGTSSCFYDAGFTGTCVTPLEKRMTWGAVFTYNDESIQINGEAVCGSVPSVTGQVGEISSDQTTLDEEYETSPAVSGGTCYCKLTSPAESLWVFRGEYGTSLKGCRYKCAQNCASAVKAGTSTLKQSMFGTIK